MSETCELITGAGESNHISSVDDAHFNYGICGSGDYILPIGGKCAATMSSANNITIADGDLLIHGRQVRIPSEVSLQMTTCSGNRIDYVLCQYHTYTGTDGNTYEDAEIILREGTETSGTPAAPSVTQGDPMYMETYEAILYTITHTGSTYVCTANLSELTDLATFPATFKSYNARINNLETDDSILMRVNAYTDPTKGNAYSSGNIRCYRAGRIAIVTMYDLVLNTVSSSSSENIIATGLPKALSGYGAIGIIDTDGSNTGAPRKVKVDESGNLLLWWCANSDSYKRYGQVVYVTAD